VAALLLVDGDRNFREALAIGLRLDGVDVTAVGSVTDADTALQSSAWSLVVVDALLPGADALLERLAATGPGRVVATGTHPEILDRAASRHRVRTLEKPFGARELQAI
jgi:DNA-binding NtrC family response regulator